MLQQTITITIEQQVVASNRSYEQVIASLEAQLGVAFDQEELRGPLTDAPKSLTSRAKWGYA